MKIKISLEKAPVRPIPKKQWQLDNRVKPLLSFFSTKAFNNAFNRSKESTRTVVFLTPDQYLNLVDPGDVYLNDKLIEGFIDKTIRYPRLPYLGVETDKEDGTLYVSLEGRDHQGRRMMKALKALGIQHVPVVVHSQYVDDGPVYRWGSTEERPSAIEGFGDFTMNFPKIETW